VAILMTILLALAALAAAPAAAGGVAPAAVRSELPRSLRGLSGLAVEPSGRLWSVAERGVALVPLRLDGDRVVPDGDPIPVRGWPVGLDAESLAWLAPGRFLVGTESLAEGRPADRLVTVRIVDGRAEVGPALVVPYAPFGLVGEANRGVEALDAVDGLLVAASEVVAAAPRGAPLWRLRPGVPAVEVATVTLTSAEGKLSSLVVAGEEIYAIERHYETVRLIAAIPAWGSAPAPVPARVVRDLAAELGPLPNLEGLARLPDGRFVLLADNQGGFATDGPTVALVLPAR
jgi:hypothetical protein